MKTHRAPVAVLLAALLALLFVAGCDGHSTDKISDLVANPDHYAGKTVTVAGEVTQVYELPLGITNLAAYRVNDSTGQIWVLSRAGAPVKGDRVGLKGNLRPEGSIGGMTLGSVIEETERRVR